MITAAPAMTIQSKRYASASLRSGLRISRSLPGGQRM